MKLTLISLTLLLHYFMNCDARPDGAPLAACSTLMPIHSGIQPSKDRSPYVVSAVPMANNKVKVTISAQDEGFQGFVLQARSKNDPSKFVSGQFTTNKDTKAIDCFNKVKNTLTHVSNAQKNEVVTEWTPDPDVNEDVVFRATVAKSYSLFWIELDSQHISIKGTAHSGAVEAIEEDKTLDLMYKNCFVTKGCFAFPDECLEEMHDCKILLTYYNVPNGVRFSLHGYLNSSTYMAVGLSEDNRMGEDSVNECIRDNSDVIVRESWNEGKSNTRTKDLPSSYSKYADGLTSCSWIKRFNFESDGKVFDLLHNNYYLLLAMGEVRAGGGLGYHSEEKIGSEDHFNLTMFDDFKEEEDSVEGIDFKSTSTDSTKSEDSSTTPVTSYTTEHNGNNGLQMSFSIFYVILALLLVRRGVQV